jgi:hypothetical protein
MGRVAVLRIRNGNFDQGFDVSLQVCRDNALPSPEILGRLPANTEVEDLYTAWQQTFIGLPTQRRTDSSWKIETISTNYSTSEVDACRYFVRKVETSMRNWLQHSQDRGWQRIRERLVKELANNSDEFRVIVSVINSELCKPPWLRWDLIESNLDVEIAFSYPNDGEPEPAQTNYNNVHILAIMGDNSGIDTEPDKDAIRQLNGAAPNFLDQPTSQDLIRELRRPEGWDIFFFAGHSQTNGTIGRIYINESESLEISDFRNALREAIRHGLKLAIFNSCEGLGLAQQLADLHIPVIIVMREPVPDEVAQSFLREFLTEYAHGQSLYTSVRRARERLEEFQDLPGAAWLPLICQNPSTVPPTWQKLSRGPRRQRWLPALKKAIVFLLPILILFRSEPETNYGSLGAALDANSGREVYLNPNPDPNNPNHLWKLEEVGDNEVMILNKVEDTGIVKALDANHRELRPMGDLYMYKKPDPHNGNHRWTLTEVGNYYMIVIRGLGVPTKALDASGGRNSPYLNSNVNPKNHNLHWKLTKVGGYHMLTPRVVHNLANDLTLEENSPQTAKSDEAKQNRDETVSSLLQNGDVISLECQGHLHPGQSFFLDGRTENGTVALASTIGGSFTGTRWKVHVIDSRNEIITLENQEHISGSKFLYGAGDGSVKLTDNTKPMSSGTKWRIRVIDSHNKVIVLENQRHISGSRFLDGVTEDGTVTLAPRTNEGFTGTQWRIIK